jgi:hypothetical protein
LAPKEGLPSLEEIPIWLIATAICVFAVGGVVSTLAAGEASVHLTMKATSVRVYRVPGKRLRYEFWSPAYRDYLKSSLTTAAPSTSQIGITPCAQSPAEPKA